MDIETKEINLMNDAMFKAFMAHKDNRALVIDLVHAITGIDKSILNKAKFISGIKIPKRIEAQKKQATDMVMDINNKKKIIIEMNQSYSSNMFEKNTLYSFSITLESTSPKMNKYPSITLINIDNFNRFKTKEAILEFKLRDEFGNIENELYKSIHLILENIIKNEYNVDKEVKEFSKFIRKTNLKDLKNTFEGDEKYMAAIRTVEQLSKDPNFVGYYDIEEAHEQELYDMKLYGIEEGKELGKEIGIEQNKKEAAINFHKNGVSDEIILKSLNITQEKLEEYLKNS